MSVTTFSICNYNIYLMTCWPLYNIIIDCKPEYEKSEYGRDIQLMVSTVQYTTFKTTKVEQDIFDKFLAYIMQKVLSE